MEVKAKLRFLKISPRKVRLVVDMIRGLPVNQALDQLSFLNKGSALPISKLLKSAMANAEHNNKLDKDNLFIKKITVDEGPTLKRWRPRAFGRAGMIRKRASHVTLVLDELKTSTKKTKKTATKKSDSKIKSKGKKEDKVKQPVVDYKDVKHESKFDKNESGTDDGNQDSQKPASGFNKIKERFSRRLGEK